MKFDYYEITEFDYQKVSKKLFRVTPGVKKKNRLIKKYQLEIPIMLKSFKSLLILKQLHINNC
jgi:hypothetical protein